MSARNRSHSRSSRANGFWNVGGAHRRKREYSLWRNGSGALAATGLAFITIASFGSSTAFGATAALNLGTASTYAVLGGTSVTNTGSSIISGNIGVNPGTSFTGMPPLVQSSGTINTANAAALQAQSDLTAAFLVAAGLTPFTNITGDLGGQTLVSGVYRGGAIGLTGTVTLTGDASSVFVFQASSTLITASGSNVVLTGGVSPCNVFWEVGSSATLGTTSTFNGSIMALTSVSLNTGASVQGRVLAQNGGVTLDGNTVIDTCSATTATTTTSSTTTSTTTPTTTTPTTTTTAATPVTTTTAPVIPIGSPGTGFGGTAGSGSNPLNLIGFGALGLAGIAGGMALRARRHN